MSTSLRDYDYVLPRELIALRPLPRRQDARMMVLDRVRQTIDHRQFVELPLFVRPGELLVLNDTRVRSARRFSDDGMIEFLFLDQLDPRRWRCLVKPGRKMRIGAMTMLDGVAVRVEEIEAEGERVVRLESEIDPCRGGKMPLPPYIDRVADADDETRYQTVFAPRTRGGGGTDRGIAFHPGNPDAIAAHFRYLARGHGHLSSGARRDHRRASNACRAVHDHRTGCGRDERG